MAPQNRALWLKEKQAPVMVVGDASYTSPGPNEIVINTKAVAINPADNVLQQTGLFLETYPAILGCDVAGVVEEAGSNTPFKPGERVIGSASCLSGYTYSGFQKYVVLKMPLVARIPEGVDFADAVVLPLGVTTAASCLFAKDVLALEMPPTQAKGTLLIWGASGSVGACGVQLATASGYEVFGVASKRNHELVKSLGATKCFDHSSPNVIDDVIAAMKGRDVVGAFDAISTADTLPKICQILAQASGRKLIAAVVPGTESMSTHGVQIQTNLAGDIVTDGVGEKVWRIFLEPALASGSFQYKPTAEIVGDGLEDVQKACDLLSQGVSAKKLVVTL